MVRALDAILPGSWNRALGIVSWHFDGLDGVIASPLLHSGWSHLVANSVPFAVLGLLVSFDGIRRFWAVTAIAAVVGGLGTWFVNSPGTLTVGASGLVFGYFGYLLVRSFVAPSLGHGILYAVVAVAVAVLYGGTMFTGIFRRREPGSPGRRTCSGRRRRRRRRSCCGPAAVAGNTRSVGGRATFGFGV